MIFRTAAATLTLALSLRSLAQPLMVNYQGRLSQISGAVFPNGPADVRVRLFDAATGGVEKWDSGELTVQVRDGVFSVLLQGGTPSLSNDVFSPGLRYFEISVKQALTWTTLQPRQAIASVPWAFWANNSMTVIDGAITTPKLAGQSVTAAKLAVDPSSLSQMTGSFVNQVNLNRLGVGTGEPSSILEIRGADPRLTINASSGYAGIDFRSYGMLRAQITDNQGLGSVDFNQAFGNEYWAYRFLFQGVEMMRITGAGRVGIGTANPTSTLDVNGTANIRKLAIGGPFDAQDYPDLQLRSATPAIGFNRGNSPDKTASISNGAEGELHISVGSNNGRLITYTTRVDLNGGLVSADKGIYTGGDLSIGGQGFKPGGGDWSVPSDIRLKRDLAPLSDPLMTFLKLRGVSFEYRDPAAIHQRGGRQAGFIAQEVEKIFPEWVQPGIQGYKALTLPVAFSALTVEAIREQQNQIEHLKSELAREKAARASLERRMAEIERALRTRR